MIEFIIFLSFLILSLFGLTELIHYISLRVLKPSKTGRRVLVVFLDEDTACQQLGYMAEVFRWQGNFYADEIIACTKYLSEETKQKCVSFFLRGPIVLTDNIDLLNTSE